MKMRPWRRLVFINWTKNSINVRGRLSADKNSMNMYVIMWPMVMGSVNKTTLFSSNTHRKKETKQNEKWRTDITEHRLGIQLHIRTFKLQMVTLDFSILHMTMQNIYDCVPEKKLQMFYPTQTIYNRENRNAEVDHSRVRGGYYKLYLRFLFNKKRQISNISTPHRKVVCHDNRNWTLYQLLGLLTTTINHLSFFDKYRIMSSIY